MAGLLAVLLVLAGGYWVRYPVVELFSSALGGDCAAAPDELTRLAGEQVFRRPPGRASPVADATLWQPCQENGSDNTGGRRVAYACQQVRSSASLSDMTCCESGGIRSNRHLLGAPAVETSIESGVSPGRSDRCAGTRSTWLVLTVITLPPVHSW